MIPNLNGDKSHQWAHTKPALSRKIFRRCQTAEKSSLLIEIMTSISTLEKKVVVVGDCGVGKTDFIAAIAGKKWRSKAKSPTVFDDRKVVFKLRWESLRIITVHPA